MPSIVKCLGDPTPAVRDAALNTLVEIYRHVGEKVRLDLEKRGNVPPAKYVSFNHRLRIVYQTNAYIHTCYYYHVLAIIMTPDSKKSIF